MSETELIEIFAGNLRSALADAKMSAAELAKWTGLSKSTITRYLNGERLPELRPLINICCTLDCTLDDLVPTYEMVN